ncbi:MAG: hypothetical protein HY764_00490 [Candidatus Portnoybacteria bacterium]|nr:hypothetical protein [Candidatus Portnoybacteria bacterium]
MKLVFKNIKDTPLNLMRRASYGFLGRDQRTGEESFAMRLSGADYPRFHIFAQKRGEELFINLHLDQKKPSYGGFTAHSGEYEDSEILEKEAERIKNSIGI